MTSGFRRFKDEIIRAATVDLPSVFSATVVSVTAGAAQDGNALVTISWHGATIPAAYSANYTPVVNHEVMVLCPFNQPTIAFRIIGTP